MRISRVNQNVETSPTRWRGLPEEATEDVEAAIGNTPAIHEADRTKPFVCASTTGIARDGRHLRRSPRSERRPQWIDALCTRDRRRDASGRSVCGAGSLAEPDRVFWDQPWSTANAPVAPALHALSVRAFVWLRPWQPTPPHVNEARFSETLSLPSFEASRSTRASAWRDERHPTSSILYRRRTSPENAWRPRRR